MLDLFAIANRCADSLKTEFDSATVGMVDAEAKRLREFAAWVESESRIAVNLRLFVLGELLNGRCHQNIYEWAHEQASLCGRTKEQVLQERLGVFYIKRVTFDRAFKDGDQFRYGAMNGGTHGLPEYGPYCMVLNRKFDSALVNIAWLPGDSLKICFEANGRLDLTMVERKSAPHSHRHFMAARERATEVPLKNRDDWPSLIAAPGRYFEAVFIGDVKIEAVQCVRVLRTEYDRMWDLAFKSFGRKLQDAERALVQDFVQLLRGMNDGRIQVELVA